MGGAAAGELYQFSGFNTVGPIVATTRCDAYNPASNTWRSVTSIPQATTHAGQVPDTDQPTNQTFWLAGGFLGNDPGPTTGQVWKYSITNNTWAAGPALPAKRAGGALVKWDANCTFSVALFVVQACGRTTEHTGLWTSIMAHHGAPRLPAAKRWRRCRIRATTWAALSSTESSTPLAASIKGTKNWRTEGGRYLRPCDQHMDPGRSHAPPDRAHHGECVRP